MGLKHFSTELYSLLTGIHAESHREMNIKEKVVYPYLTYDFDITPLDLGTDGFYLDIDVFDRGTSFVNITNLESKLKKTLHRHYFNTDRAFFRVRYEGSTKVPTLDADLKRRNLRFYIKLDWRDING